MHKIAPSILAVALLSSTALLADPNTAIADEFPELEKSLGQWVRVSDPEDDAAIPTGISAYSGMCIDPKGRRLLVFGGGHGDYFGNEVRAWDFSTRKWSLLTEPTPRERYLTTRWDWDNAPGMFPDLRLPVSRHTYDAIEWIDHLGVMYAGGSSTWSGRGEDEPLWDKTYVKHATGARREQGWGPFDTWLFDPAEAKWTYLRPPEELIDGGNFCAYSPDHQVVVVMRSGTVGTTAPALFDPDRARWTIGKPFNPGGGIHQSMTYDSKRKRCYVVGLEDNPATVATYDIDNDAWGTIETHGEAPALRGGTGSACDAAADLLVTFGPQGGWVLDLAAGRWQAIPSHDAAPAPAEIYGRLKCDAGANAAFLLVPDKEGKLGVWACRHAAADERAAE